MILFASQNVVHHFTQLACDQRCSFLGNVKVGRDVGIEELRNRYDAVVLAYGAESDKSLGVPGEVQASCASVAPHPGIDATGTCLWDVENASCAHA